MRVLIFILLFPTIVFAQYSSSKNSDFLLPFSIGSAVIGLATTFNSSPLDIIEIEYASTINNFDDLNIEFNQDYAILSDYLIGLQLVSSATILFSGASESQMLLGTRMIGESLLLNLGLNLITKNTVQRYRPNLSDDNTSLIQKVSPDSRRSFYSGHASTAFTIATFNAIYYSNMFPNNEFLPYLIAGNFLMLLPFQL